MAEFQEVIRQFKRICDAAEGYCSKCGIGDISCSMVDIVNNTNEFEKRVMEWAALHPEPVYPTWYEYVWSQLAKKEPISDHDLATWMENNRIPADIAQRLGIAPKMN